MGEASTETIVGRRTVGFTFVAGWSALGVALVLAESALRLGAHALHGLGAGLAPHEWACFGVTRR